MNAFVGPHRQGNQLGASAEESIASATLQEKMSEEEATQRPLSTYRLRVGKAFIDLRVEA